MSSKTGEILLRLAATIFCCCLTLSLFKSFGISGEEIEQQLQKIENALPGLAPENETVRQQIAQVQSNIEQARFAVRTAYQTVGG